MVSRSILHKPVPPRQHRQQSTQAGLPELSSRGPPTRDLSIPQHSIPLRIASTSIRSIKSLVPLLDRVLVQRIKAEAKTASGIFLPESSVKELNEAKVLAVGPGALDKEGKRLPVGVQAGDRVLIPTFGGSPVKVGEDEYALFRDSEILAKINE
ncbi:mitochondrial heat shock protein Hsp10 [Diaporthe australafricana]|uniref:Mitochondrial heat shock protein Hsp10 n=1 Tax=Diaporthe australafricana TaxID=127596 RepID=A0ABR3XW09_9PEZI